MDPTHFGLRQRPFPNTPDSACYYPATGHERALAQLQQGLADGEGLLQLTGGPGSGKTLLCHCLLDRLGGEARTAFLTQGRFRDRAALLQAVLYDLALPYEGRGEQELRLALTDHLLAGFAEGRPTVLLLDEAQHLTPDLLEELRLLGNLEARSGKALQVLLVGQPALVETLRAPGLAALRQRLAVRAELEPLGVQEAADYLLHHLRIAGARPGEVMADESLELLARGTGGVPRLLNQAAAEALALAREAGAAFVDVEAALEALARLGLEAPPEATPDAEADSGPILVGSGAEGAEASPQAGGEENSDENDPSCRLYVEPRRPA
jgi:type II secretory pathway predicted ATPase ExeA